jgi:fluoride exporter
VNASGSFLLGLLLSMLTERFMAPLGLRLFLAIGLLGAYTTFSTFSYESLALLQTRAYVPAAIDMAGTARRAVRTGVPRP